MSTPYKFQPIVRLHEKEVFGYEILYRGPAMSDWNAVDRNILAYLRGGSRNLPTLFVNLSNECFILTPNEQLIEAARQNDIFFELSETIATAELFTAISEKVNLLTQAGVKFAIDDFGSGHDGLGRTFALKQIAIVKVDGTMLHQAMTQEKNASMLRRVVSQWRDDGTLTVAECVETPAMLQFARDLEFDLVQGWHVDDMVPTLALAAA